MSGSIALRGVVAALLLACFSLAACGRSLDNEEKAYKSNRDKISVLGTKVPMHKADFEKKLAEFEKEYQDAKKGAGDEQAKKLSDLNNRMTAYISEFDGSKAPANMGPKPPVGPPPAVGTGKLNQPQPTAAPMPAGHPGLPPGHPPIGAPSGGMGAPPAAAPAPRPGGATGAMGAPAPVAPGAPPAKMGAPSAPPPAPAPAGGGMGGK